ncbi:MULTISPECIES: hypothetical protein [unclassified Bradyrhizobium]|uniref:hypothetical protein n=1 Tax=unclassified Bradyrhizobium TaxID=2631580 RepID=UPI001CD30D85|nr:MULTISPECIES: hypothetical protein [unclassified Bradyrhizobium]MCA1386038.1 hypothetical protein [Bradyrhizobium sp. BRP05]MCA1393836.1 hypothetical protein [Bradyrhizobium sp. IC3123]MCA1423480.1 hypothetical protein [Bradyrhizobium sp. BRP23]MCA1430626.1 hypothetical protein [Bradyrhizobium sp. NBAIM16]MCA1471203.1 hypothetical protein [Bradyrhizobium sp. IC3195]
MPLVFVHGVNTRRGNTPQEQRVFDDRSTLLQQQLAHVAFIDRVKTADGLKTFAPYWGDLGVKFARNFASLPTSGAQTLAVGQPARVDLVTSTAAKLDGELVNKPTLNSDPLLTVARARSLPAAVDLLFAGSSNAPKAGPLAQALTNALPDVARFSLVAEAYAAANRNPSWLQTVKNDSEFVEELFRSVTALSATSSEAATGANGTIQTLAIGNSVLNWLKTGATAIKDAVSEVTKNVKDAVGGAAVDATRAAFLGLSEYVRPSASTFAGRFVGDVFTYMDNRQPIVERVIAAIKEANAARRPGDEELYLVGHSFGGIILYDILTHFAKDLRCDLFVTVGSQVALFAEMGRLAAASELAEPFAKGEPADLPAAVSRWINVYDLTDYVGFATKGVFKDVLDFEFETDALPIISHAAYFDTPRFFARLRERVKELFEEKGAQV